MRILCIGLATLGLLLPNATIGAEDWKEVEAHYQRAQEALRNGENEKATSEFREILRIQPTNAQAYANLGVMAFTQKNFDEASREFRTALKLQPLLWNAVAFLGMCEIHQSRHQDAMRHLESSFPHLRDAKLQHEVGMNLVALYYESGDIPKTVDILRVLEHADGKAPDVLYAAYRAYSDLAANALASLAQAAPESAEMHQILAQNLANQDDFEGAITHFQEALKLDPKLPGLHYELGQTILANSNAEQARGRAETEFKQDLAINPTNAGSQYMLGAIAWSRSKREEALQYYLKALELRPEFVDAHIAAGKALTSLGRSKEAVDQLREAVRLDPENEVAHYRLAQAYREQGRLAEADHETAIFREIRSSHEPVRELYQQTLRRGGLHETVEPSTSTP